MKFRPTAATSTSTSLGPGSVRAVLQAWSESQNPRSRHFEPEAFLGCLDHPAHAVHVARGDGQEPAHVSEFAVQRDLVLRVGPIAQFRDERGDFLPGSRRQIDQLEVVVLVFVDRHPSEAPERGLRQLQRFPALIERLRRVRY